MAKDPRDTQSEDWVDADEDRRYKEELAYARRKARQERIGERQKSQGPASDRAQPKT